MSKEVIRFTVKATSKRDIEHFNAQLKYKANVYRDRTKYTRKIKHKGIDNE